MEEANFTYYQVRKAKADIEEIQKNLKEFRQDAKRQDDRINEQDKQIALISQQLNTIVNNTGETKRIVRQAVIGAVATGIIGGVIGLVWSAIGG